MRTSAQPLLLMIPLLLALTGCNSTSTQPETGYEPGKLAEVNVQLGIAYMKQGQNKVALKKFRHALELDPSYPMAHNMLGVLYERLGEDDKAEAEYRRSVALAPRNPVILNNYGQFLCQRKHFHEAEEQFLAALANPLYTTPEVAYTNAGTCMEQSGDLARAEDYYRKALDSNPKMPTALFRMAGISYHKKRFLSARGYLQRYLANASQDPESLWLGIRIERQLGDHDTEASYTLLLRSKFPTSRQVQLLEEEAP